MLECQVKAFVKGFESLQISIWLNSAIVRIHSLRAWKCSLGLPPNLSIDKLKTIKIKIPP